MAYDAQGPAPLLNRAWPRRGWASPPPFGLSVPGLMEETSVTFTRQGTAPNAIGGYGAGNADPVTVWATVAHVEVTEEDRPRYTGEMGETVQDMGVTIYRHYEIYTGLPPDPANLPRKGDWVAFTDGIKAVRLPVMRVEVNAGLLDHLEIYTDEFV